MLGLPGLSFDRRRGECHPPTGQTATSSTMKAITDPARQALKGQAPPLNSSPRHRRIQARNVVREPRKVTAKHQLDHLFSSALVSFALFLSLSDKFVCSYPDIIPRASRPQHGGWDDESSARYRGRLSCLLVSTNHSLHFTASGIPVRLV